MWDPNLVVVSVQERTGLYFLSCIRPDGIELEKKKKKIIHELWKDSHPQRGLNIFLKNG